MYGGWRNLSPIFFIMIYFKELKIDQQTKKLIISAAVNEAQYFSKVYIDKVLISTEHLSSWPTDESKYYVISDINSKNYYNCLSAKDMLVYNLDSFGNNILFVYVKTKGTPSIDTPCGCDNEITLGVVYDKSIIYNKLLSYIKEVSNNCTIPKELINVYLQYKLFDTAIKSGNYTSASKIWNGLYSNIKVDSQIKICGCNGK